MNASLEEQELYKENILDHYKYPRNKKEINAPSCSENNPLCGDKITLYLKIEDGTIVDVSFTGEGCAISQASASLLSEYVKDKTVEEIELVDKDKVYSLLGIQISYTREKCALLSLKALRGVLKC